MDSSEECALKVPRLAAASALCGLSHPRSTCRVLRPSWQQIKNRTGAGGRREEGERLPLQTTMRKLRETT
eukprot:2109205-Amphidinium_carterae.1